MNSPRFVLRRAVFTLALLGLFTLAPAVAARAQSAPELKNGSMNDGKDQPEGWGTWRGEGTLTLSRDTKNFVRGPASLCLRTGPEGGYGNASQTIQPTGTAFVLKGSVKLEGAAAEECQVAVQVFAQGQPTKQLDWIQVEVPEVGKGWTEFSKQISLPAETAFANVLVVLKGKNSTVWLDEVTITAAE